MRALYQTRRYATAPYSIYSALTHLLTG